MNCPLLIAHEMSALINRMGILPFIVGKEKNYELDLSPIRLGADNEDTGSIQ
jgi:hypothetical protein